MFAPIGYIPFTTVFDASSQVTEQRYRSSIVELASAKEGNPSIEPSDEEYKKIRKEEDLMLAWLLAQIMQQFETYVCSPSGTVFRCASLIHFHEDLLSWYAWAFLASHHDAIGIPAEQPEEEPSPEPELIQGNPLNRFRFIDVVTGTISVSSREAELQKFLTDAAEDPEPQTSVARQFDGWAVCFKETDFGDDVYETIFEFLHNELAPPVSGDARKSLGRPRKVDEAADAYMRAFPEGRGQLTWEQAKSRVVEMTGNSISAQALAREIKRRTDPESDKSPSQK